MSEKIDLAKKWIEFKTKEDEFKKLRIEIENIILQSYDLENKSGSNNFENMLTITTDYDRKWDKKGLDRLRDQLPSDAPFPFKTEYKEDRKMCDALEKMAEEYFKTNFEPLLTVKPKKPSFKVR